MREPSKIRAAALLLILLAAATPAHAGDLQQSVASGAAQMAAPGHRLASVPVLPGFLYTPDVTVAQAGCVTPTHSSRFLEWWRQTWGTGVTHRGRPEESEQERPSATFYYLRSPLLSGLYGRATDGADCAGGGASARPPEEPRCALVTLRLVEHERLKRIEVPLPQLEARTPRQLESAINGRIENGKTVVLSRMDGDSFRVVPGFIRGIATGACGAEQ